MIMTRRAFLKMACSLMGPRAVAGLLIPARMVPVPPSIMLHARQDHLDNLSALIDWLLDQGLAPVTYRALWERLTAGGPLPANPVIVSIDDLILVKGSNNFYFFEKMVNVFIEKGVPVTLALNTEPMGTGANGQLVQLKDQDDNLWAAAKGWLDYGVELSTHTHSHQDLTDPGLRPEDYQDEIGGSAQMIVERTGQPVTTLVLPYGSGLGADGALISPIVEACRAAGIGMVVGIAGGRTPLVAAPAQTQPVYFVGRVGPVRGDFNTIYGDVQYWVNQNAAYHVASDLP
jgi:peptidoglycan/xylan/chitin deacetylase (PgdA/CDA1 family)